MKYRRMPIEEESPEQLGYDKIRYNLTESSVRDRSLSDLGIEMADMLLFYGDHAGGHPNSLAIADFHSDGYPHSEKRQAERGAL